MLFNSFGFIFAFFPIVLMAYGIFQHLLGKRNKGWTKERMFLLFLFLMSLLFYGWSYPKCVFFLLVSMGGNYFLAMGMLHKKEKTVPILWIGIVLNVAALVLVKCLQLTAPGISFFTFSQIAFLVEICRGMQEEVSFLEYGLYISFFPKLIQGPIALPKDMLKQFSAYCMRTDWERMFRGIYLFVLGLFKKVLIADTLGGAADFGFASPEILNSGDAWIVMVSYALQLYFDFSGYCDMAMGLAGMIGFDLPLNFNAPYQSADIIEFWDRWHITLTTFFTKYIYIPLGGSRKGRVRTYVNCMIVFLISGFWHGTGWQFLIWGMMHGTLTVFTRMWREWKEKKKITAGLPHGICVCLTFLYVNVAWVFFRASSVENALALLKKLVSFEFGRINWDLAKCFNLDEFWYVIKVLGADSWQYAHYILMVLLLTAVLLLVFKARTAVDYVKTVKPDVLHVLAMAVMFVWSVVTMSEVSSFLYFNF